MTFMESNMNMNSHVSQRLYELHCQYTVNGFHLVRRVIRKEKVKERRKKTPKTTIHALDLHFEYTTSIIG